MILLPGALGLPSGESQAFGDDDLNVCEFHIKQTELKYGFPVDILGAISRVESGRWDKARGRLAPWPWTVMAEGKGRYLSSKAEAIGVVKNLKARGVKNIDVGCMQINLYWHPKAFANLDEALDPQKNVAYAGELLFSLHKKYPGSWGYTIAKYHSSTHSYMTRYINKIMDTWAENHNARQKKHAATTGTTNLVKRQKPNMYAELPELMQKSPTIFVSYDPAPVTSIARNESGPRGIRSRIDKKASLLPGTSTPLPGTSDKALLEANSIEPTSEAMSSFQRLQQRNSNTASSSMGPIRVIRPAKASLLTKLKWPLPSDDEALKKPFLSR